MQVKQRHLRLKTAWKLSIVGSLKKLAFAQSTSDQCLLKRQKADKKLYIIVYVDHLLIAEKDRDVNDIIEELQMEYEVKNLGHANYYLGIR